MTLRMTAGGKALCALGRAGLTQLTSLDLSDTAVSDQGMPHLACAHTCAAPGPAHVCAGTGPRVRSIGAGLTRLTTLSLFYSGVSDAGVAHLSGAPRLSLSHTSGAPRHVCASACCACAASHAEGGSTESQRSPIIRTVGGTLILWAWWVMWVLGGTMRYCAMHVLVALTRLTRLNIDSRHVTDAALSHLSSECRDERPCHPCNVQRAICAIRATRATCIATRAT
jgi:hypothetical protein